MKRLLFLLLMAACTSASAQVSAGEAKKWRNDLHELTRQLTDRHVDLYRSVSREDLQKAVVGLDQNIPSMTTPQILIAFGQLVAMIGDGHTSFFPGNQKNRWFRFYPINLWSFSDGIHVIAAPKEYSHLFGKRLVRIDDTPIEEAFSAVSTIIAADNDMEYEYSVPFDLVRSETLHVLGIARSADQAEFVFEGGIKETFQAIGLKEWQTVERVSANSLYGGERPPNLKVDLLFATSLTLRHVKQREYYWFTYLPDEQAIYLQYNVCWDQKDRPAFSEMTGEMFQYMEDHPVERLIVDVRQNAGGEPLIAQSLIDGLVKRKEFTEEGRLFVLTGRRTFSAALTNAVHLRSMAGARIVGEPPRGKPNNPSEGRDINLKKTKIWATVSTQYVERDATLGDAPYLPVDIEVPLTFEAYQAAEDLVLQAALSAKVKE